MATRAPADAGPGDIHAQVVPRPVAGLVGRPRLFALLDRGIQGPVTLLSAPAGSGKTTLLSSWLRSADAPRAVAWVGIERDAADATHFWRTAMEGSAARARSRRTIRSRRSSRRRSRARASSSSA